jgi:hypothetical protein
MPASQGFHLPPEAVVDIPSSFYANLKILRFDQTTIDGETLAGMLSQCPQLEDLQVVRTNITGSADPLSVLGRLKTLSLKLTIEEVDVAEGGQCLTFLQHLGDCLTSLDVHTEDRWDLDEQLIRVTATHLHRLQHLTITNGNGSFPEADVFGQLASSPAAQTLETMSLMITIPDMESVAKVLAMPKLHLLKEVTFPEPMFRMTDEDPVAAENLAGFKVHWPEGKPPMQLRASRASVAQLALLPLQHFKQVRVGQLALPRRASRQERAAALQALMTAAQQCPDFCICCFQTHPGDSLAGGLSVLGSGCPLKLAYPGSLEFMRIDLEETDMQGVVAAYGKGLMKFNFFNSTLSAGAWAAINPTNFPALHTLRLNSDDPDFIPYLTALCMEWPAEHPLTIKLHHLGELEPLAAHIPKLLEARGRQNPTVSITEF